MQIIIVSNPTALEHEAVLINKLFDEGMQLFHLRKPDYSENEMEKLLEDIKAEYHVHISLHQHHGLASKFKIKRIHFTEQKRKGTRESELKELFDNGNILSTSIHDIKDHANLSEYFSYAFYGPVFESISKPEHKPKTELPQLEKEERKTKIIGIGGVTPDNIVTLHQANFDGAALLGSIWTVIGKEIIKNGKA